MVVESMLPLIAILIPLLGAVTIPILGKKIDKYVNKFTALLTILIFLDVLSMYPEIAKGNVLEFIINTGFRIDFHCRVDSLGFIIGLIASFVWMCSSIYAIEYMSHEHAQKRYNMFSLLSLTGMLGVVFTGNLFSLYLVFELLSVASYILVIHEESPEAMRAGMIYLFMGIGGGLILLFSILSTYAIAGTGDFANLAMKLSGNSMLPYIFWGYIIGFGVKAGLFPLHIWLPSAHPVAPSPGSALLSGVMIKAGAYGILRTIYSIMGVELIRGTTMVTILLVLALITIFLGSAIAISQKEIKSMLAYSSISQIGYIIMGIALLTPTGLMGSVIHIFNHAIIKSTLFLSAGAFIHQVGLRNLVDLEGIGKRMPIVTACFTFAGLAMVGFPPFNGFISKWFLATGALEVAKYGSYGFYVGVICVTTLMLSSLMNLVYYGPILYKAWFGGEGEEHGTNGMEHGGGSGHDAHVGHDSHGEAHTKSEDPNLFMLIPLVTLAFGILYFGLFPQFPVSFAQKVSEMFYPVAGSCIH